MKLINGNILNVENGYVCHQVNCKGIMGGGLAKQIKEFDYDVFLKYRDLVVKENGELLGEIQFVDSKNGITFINMFAQDDCGCLEQYTDYKAFEMCLSKIKNSVDKTKPIYIPYGIGCGLGGGDWNIVSNLIKSYIPDVIIVKY